jgi:hypothetical protein
VVFCLDELEVFEGFDVVADSAVGEWFFFVALADFLVTCVDVAGLYCVLFLGEFLDGLVD